DLADKQQGLVAYLKEDLSGEVNPRRVETQIRRFHVSRGKLLDEVEQTVAEVQALLARIERLPAGFVSSLDHTGARIAAMRSLIDDNLALYQDLLAEPPIERTSGRTNTSARAAATAALSQILRSESRVSSQAN